MCRTVRGNYLCLWMSLGKSLRNRSICVVMLPLAMIMVTETMIMTIPVASFGVNASPKIVTPKMTAVTGSKAPRIAVGVEPIYWMALVVDTKDMAVGKRANATILPHRNHLEGTISWFPARIMATNTESPNIRT